MEKFAMPKELVMCMNGRRQCLRVLVTKDGTVKPVKQTIPISWVNKKISWEVKIFRKYGAREFVRQILFQIKFAGNKLYFLFTW